MQTQQTDKKIQTETETGNKGEGKAAKSNANLKSGKDTNIRT